MQIGCNNELALCEIQIHGPLVLVGWFYGMLTFWGYFMLKSDNQLWSPNIEGTKSYFHNHSKLVNTLLSQSDQFDP